MLYPYYGRHCNVEGHRALSCCMIGRRATGAGMRLRLESADYIRLKCAGHNYFSGGNNFIVISDVVTYVSNRILGNCDQSIRHSFSLFFNAFTTETDVWEA